MKRRLHLIYISINCFWGKCTGSFYQSQRFFKFNLLFYQNIGSNWRGPELRLWECRHAFVHRFTGLISVFRWHSYECLSAVRPIAIQCLDNIIRILSVELSNFSGVLILGLGLFYVQQWSFDEYWEIHDF